MTMPLTNRSVLAVIPARGGSKGVPRKNIRPFGGKPLLAWSIDAAKHSKYIDKVIVSTEDEEIAGIARQWGADVPFMRPPELALDDTPGVDPVWHAMDRMPGYDVMVLLQPTSPLRLAEDIDGCLDLLSRSGAASCLSVTEPDKSPYWMYRLGPDARMDAIVKTETLIARRQDLPQAYALNGSVYAVTREWLQANRTLISHDAVGYVMPKQRSLDIDDQLDFEIGELMLRRLFTSGS